MTLLPPAPDAQLAATPVPADRRPRRRPWAVSAAACALLLSACGGGNGTSEANRPEAGEPRVGALSASQPGELLTYVRTKARERLAQAANSPVVDLVASPSPTAAPAPTSGPSGSPSARSGTTVQEAGVDEADLIKSAGDLIVTVDAIAVSQGQADNPTVRAHRRLADGALQAIGSLVLPGDTQRWSRVSGLLMNTLGSQGAVVGDVVTPYLGPPCLGGAATPGSGSSGTAVAIDCIPAVGPPTLAISPFPGLVQTGVRVQAVAFATTGSTGTPSAGTRLDISGSLVGSRLIGDRLYVVTRYAPRLSIDTLPATVSAADRDAALQRLSIDEVLPTVRVNGGEPQALVTDTDCYLQGANASDAVEVTTITTINLADSGLPRQSRCILGGTEALYLSPTSLVLATTRYTYTGDGSATRPWRYPFDITTDLHRFALNAADTGSSGTVAYRASGTVKGHLGWDSNRKPYRISEHNGDLRVLTFTGEVGWGILDDANRVDASPATLTVLRERTGTNSADRSLQVVSTLPNAQRPGLLGRAGEQLYGVRFLGDRAYLVTFRQTDPLYVLDLDDPADPRIAGELQVPGFSDYLYPLPNGLLLGVGRDADTRTGMVGGVKVSLFDVANPAALRELGTRSFGSRGSTSGVDYSAQGINLLTTSGAVRVALPLATAGADFQPEDQGLMRFEVDTAARTLTSKPLIRAAGADRNIGIAQDRSIQIGDQLYYLAQGQLLRVGW